MNGGYEEGYLRCPCFWGRCPGSLVRQFMAQTGSVEGLRVLDLGCGEGKNAQALAAAGATVVAVDCSLAAIENGQRELAHNAIEWVLLDAESYLQDCGNFDIVIMYGLLHCLESLARIKSVVELALRRTKQHGHHIVVAFNNGPQDLSAHPGFSPTLVPHEQFVDLYKSEQILLAKNDLIHETHPHNGIPHFHSLTRLIVRRVL